MSGVLFYNKCRIKTDVLTSIQLTEAEEKDVNFYDYDGFRLLSYTNAEALALTELPANPVVNENLTFDEWNWTLVDIKTQINNVGGVVNVGAIYHTTDNKTHITCKPTKNFPNAYVCLKPTTADAVTVDWGDGTTDIWTSTSQTTKEHTYEDTRESCVYDITISCSSGTYSFPTYIAGTSYQFNNFCNYTDIKLSNKVASLGNNCFNSCVSLQTISLSNTITSFGNSCFNACNSLQAVVIPLKSNLTIGSSFLNNCFAIKRISLPRVNNFVSVGTNCFYYCTSMENVTIPYSFTQLGAACFTQCFSIRSIIIPNNVTTIGDNCFSYCYSLQYVTFPTNSNFKSFGSSCFQNCYTLQSITIPSTITSIGSNCFKNCYSLSKLYVKPSTPPTLSATNAIPDNTNLVIYVPTGKLATYQSANNWSTFASKMVEYTF